MTDHEGGILHAVRDVVLKGSVTIKDSQWYGLYANDFFIAYNELDEFRHMKLPPIEVDLKSRTFSISPAFLKQVSDAQLQAYREVFLDYFESFEDANGFGYESDDAFDEDDDDEDDDLDEMEEEDPGIEWPDLPYRVSSEKYSDWALNVMLSPDATDFKKPDSYGWIEDRRAAMMDDLIDLCDSYALPRLPVVFNEKDGSVQFRAGKEEIGRLQDLFEKRTQELDDASDALLKKMNAEWGDGLALQSGDDRERDLLEKFEEEHMSRMKSHRAACAERWHMEMPLHRFPSQIKAYTCEVLDDFEENFDEDEYKKFECMADMKDIVPLGEVRVKPVDLCFN